MIDEIKLALTIVATSVIKWLMTESVPPENETAKQKKVRVRRSIGGIAAGILIGYYGHEPFIRWVPTLTEDDKTLVAILLTIAGEHIVRTIVERGPKIIEKRLGIGSDESND